jgi:hypothetical protein
MHTSIRYSLLFTGIAAASFVGHVAAATTLRFADVKEDHWAYKAIQYVSDQGLMKGMGDGTFAPDAPVTRAQLAMIMYRADGSPYSVYEEEYPQTALPEARDAQRRSDVNTILNAIYQYAIDNNGILPSEDINETATEICRSGTTSCTGLIDLDVLTGAYLVSIPSDPTGSTSRRTGYKIKLDDSGRITVSAPHAEGSGTISVTR